MHGLTLLVLLLAALTLLAATAMLEFEILPVTLFQQNCTLIWCGNSRDAALIDPSGEPEKILALIERTGVQLKQILLTHGHVDHMGAASVLAERLGVPTSGPHEDDDFLFRSLPEQCAMFGVPPIQPFTSGRWLAVGDTIRVGEVVLNVLHCPEHTPGHIVFSSAEDRLAQVGDVLFRGSIGRTDFPRGDYPHPYAGTVRTRRRRFARYLWSNGATEKNSTMLEPEAIEVDSETRTVP